MVHDEESVRCGKYHRYWETSIPRAAHGGGWVALAHCGGAQLIIKAKLMRVAYVVPGSADDLGAWSGLNFFIRKSIIDQGCYVHTFDELGSPYSLFLRLKRRLYRSFLGQHFAFERNRSVVSQWAEIAAKRMSVAGKFDVVLSPSSIPLAFLQCEAPKVMWADATFHSLRVSYPGFSHYCRASVESGDQVERAAYERAALLCYASEWAANDAIDYYGVPRNKVRVIPFGANCESPFSSEEYTLAHIRQRAFSTTHFVFIGVDWERKGGDLAVAIVRRLNELGVKSRLSVIGCRPALSAPDAPFVECLGFLPKSDAGDVARLQNTLMQSHFLLVPTSAECYGLVFAEACAFALPSISRAVGGVPTIVRHGKTGVLFPPDAGAEAYCRELLTLIEDRKWYEDMCLEAWRDHVCRLNWRVAGAQLVNCLSELLVREPITDGQQKINFAKR